MNVLTFLVGHSSFVIQPTKSVLRLTVNCSTCIAALAMLGVSASANELLLVAPAALEDEEGNEELFTGGIPPSGGIRTQFIYDSSDFSGLPEGPKTIVSMAWRPDFTVTSPLETSAEYSVWLSTTNAEPGALSNTFADNTGNADETLVYSGPVTFQTDGAGPADGPRPFDYLFEFQTPFTYDPSQGNLLVDSTVEPVPGATPPRVDGQTASITQGLFAPDPSATRAMAPIDLRIVTQFAFEQETTTALRAGDANQDFQFDQLDIVRVQTAGKYLTGQPATWGEGDWDGAPGGEPGNPPAGNGMFDQPDIIAALSPAHYLTGRYAAVRPGGQRGDGQASVGYHAGTGEFWVDAPAGMKLTSINIDSAAGIFTGHPAQSLGGSFDNDADNNIFKATFGSSFGSLSFGNTARPGLSQDFMLSDLTVVGSLSGGGDLGDVDLVYVPEPSSLVLLALAGLSIMSALHRRTAFVHRNANRRG